MNSKRRPRNRGGPPQRGANRALPASQRRLCRPIIRPSPQLPIQQTITEITTVGEYPLETNTLSSSETEQLQELVSFFFISMISRFLLDYDLDMLYFRTISLHHSFNHQRPIMLNQKWKKVSIFNRII